MSEKRAEQGEPGKPEVQKLEPGYANGYGINNRFFLTSHMTRIADRTWGKGPVK